MTARFADLPLKQKLLLVITGTSVLALALTCAGFIAYEVSSYREQVGRDLDLRAAMLAAAGAPALAFRDAKDAEETLAVMKVDPHVISAQFYASDGRIFASYARADARGEAPERPERDGRSFTWARHTIVQGVGLAGRRIGTVRLTRDVGEMRGNLAAVLAISVFLLIASSLTALAIAARTQRMISEPILDLTRAAKAIAEREDYSTRARARGGDELGILVSAFNGMLDQIQRRDAALHDSQQRLSLLVESTPLGVIVWSTGMRVVEWNKSAERIFGWSAEEARGRTAPFILEPRVWEEQIKSVWADLIARRGGTRYTSENVVKGGNSIVCDWYNAPLVGPDGKVLAVASLVEDITDKRRAQEQLVRSESRYRAILRGVPDTLFRFNSKGDYLDYEASDPKLLPFPPEAFMGRNIRDVVPPEFADHCLLGISRANATGELQLAECELPMPDGRKSALEVRFVALQGGDVLAVVRDVSERKRAQDELRNLTAQLERRVTERTAELESLNRELESFSYSVSHDLRAPLRAINGFSRLLLDKQAERLEPGSRDYLARIAEAAHHMAEIIDDLLDLSRVTRSAMQPVEVDLSRLARSVMSELSGLHPERNVEIAIDDCAPVKGDENLLRLLLENLLSNAWKFTSRTTAPRIEFRCRLEAGRRIFSVRDNGAGFDPAYADKLFKPFSRLHSEAEFSGTGVGLATVARIVERHGGRIWAESGEGKGAVFHFVLPEV